jgi:hypothetical protein
MRTFGVLVCIQFGRRWCWTNIRNELPDDDEVSGRVVGMERVKVEDQLAR